jgi:hypothetical protein
MALSKDPGSTANTAYNIGNLSEFQSFTEFIGSTDNTDIYKFTLTETKNLSLTLKDLSQNSIKANLYIDSNNNGQIDDGERLYDTRAYNGSSYGRINATLGAANYFIRLDREYDTTNTNYTLDLSSLANPPSIAKDPGSTANAAYNIGNLSGLQSLTEFIGSTDSTDIYKFTLTETKNLSLTLKDLSQNSIKANLYIDSNNNGQIDDGEKLYDTRAYNGSSYGRINATLGAANYFIRLDREYDTTNTNYTLDLSSLANPPSIAKDPGSTADTAYNIGYLNLGTSEDHRNFQEFIGSTDNKAHLPHVKM